MRFPVPGAGCHLQSLFQTEDHVPDFIRGGIHGTHTQTIITEACPDAPCRGRLLSYRPCLLVFPKRQGFFLLSSAIFLCSCIRAASLFRKIRGKSYLVLEGICTGYCPKRFVKYREIYLLDAEGVPHTLFIGKDHKIRTGCSYRFYSREQRAKVMLA